METTIPITQLHTHITEMLNQLRENPALVFKIVDHNKVVAELKAPASPAQEEDSLEQEILEFIQAYQRGEIKPRENAWEDIRKICATDTPPYPTLEETMRATRHRYLP